MGIKGDHGRMGMKRAKSWKLAKAWLPIAKAWYLAAVADDGMDGISLPRHRDVAARTLAAPGSKVLEIACALIPRSLSRNKTILGSFQSHHEIPAVEPGNSPPRALTSQRRRRGTKAVLATKSTLVALTWGECFGLLSHKLAIQLTSVVFKLGRSPSVSFHVLQKTEEPFRHVH